MGDGYSPNATYHHCTRCGLDFDEIEAELHDERVRANHLNDELNAETEKLQQAQAGGKVQPFGRGGEVQSDHDQYPARVLTRTAVHMRAGLKALAACQSKVAWMPCGPGISIRGRGR